MFTRRLCALSILAALANGATPPTAFAADGEMTFKVRIENISKPGAIKTISGSAVDVVLAPGVWVVHTRPGPLFAAGELDRGQGLESAAEDGNPAAIVASLEAMKSASGSGSAMAKDKPMRDAMPSGDSAQKKADEKPSARAMADVLAVGVIRERAGGGAGVLPPGAAYEFIVTARPGSRLSFATMFAQSNDCFYGAADAGIALFDEKGRPTTGDVTSQITLWDAGTEVNQELGAGPDQGARQSGPNTGASEKNKVQPVNDGFTYPRTADAIRVTLTPMKSE